MSAVSRLVLQALQLPTDQQLLNWESHQHGPHKILLGLRHQQEMLVNVIVPLHGAASRVLRQM